MIDDNGKMRDRITKLNDGKLDKVYHQTVKKVTEDFEELHFNTAISQMMILSTKHIKRRCITIRLHERSCTIDCAISTTYG